MELSFIEKENKNPWNDFLIRHQGSFLQSFEWGEFQKMLSKKVWRMELREREKTLLQAQIIKEKRFFKSYLYLPYGPIFNLETSLSDREKALSVLLENIQSLAHKEKAFFFRVEPISPLFSISGFDFQNPAVRTQPQKTMVLDLGKTEEELLRSFRKRTRYNIRLAEKKGVEIKISDRYSDIFYKLLKKTKERQGFRSYPEIYYKKLFRVNNDYFKVNLFLAEYQNEVIVASIIIFFDGRATSLHTGSDSEYSAFKAPYLLRWKTILEAKKRGYKEYDLWGIDEKKWPGVTHLKKSFRGREVEYGPAEDIVFEQNWYKIYKIIRKLII